jgi:flagellar biosynthesis protein FliR
MLAEFLQLNLFAFFLVFFRIGMIMLLLPGFSAAYVSAQARLVIALGLTLMLAPLLVDILPVMPESGVALTLLIVGEVIVGSAIGLAIRILLGALQTAGMLIALVSSLANALIHDPIAEQQSSLLSSFLGTVGVVLIFVMDLHHLMIRSAVESYTMFLPGQSLPIGDFTDLLARRVADSFRLGVQMASPFVIVSVVFNTGMGILGRLMPALPVFFFAMPLLIMSQILLLAAALSTMLMYYLAP